VGIRITDYKINTVSGTDVGIRITDCKMNTISDTDVGIRITDCKLKTKNVTVVCIRITDCKRNTISDINVWIRITDRKKNTVIDTDDGTKTTDYKMNTIMIQMLVLGSYFLQFLAKAKNGNNTQTPHINITTATVEIIKFLGLTIDTILNWKHHISDLKPRLNKACYAIRSIKPFMSLVVLKSTYYSYARCATSYGLIFWGKFD
jgi:hypothetical protein